MRITGTLNLDTDGNGVYEATVDNEDSDVERAVDELKARMASMLSEDAA